MTCGGEFATMRSIMKRTFLYLTMLAGIFAGAVAPAAYADASDAPKAAQKVKQPTVRQILKHAEYLNEDRPMKKAKYYVYLHSASWCPPCRALMPKIVAEYPKMKEKGVEILLVGHDKQAPAAKQYLEHYKAGFAGFLASSPTAASLPGYTSPTGIPHATIVTNKGKVLYNGPGGGLLNWETICKPEKKSKKKKK